MITSKKFYFLRHRNLCQGQRDIALCQSSLNEIEELSYLISSIPLKKIVSSPLIRALQTAQIIQNKGSYPIQGVDDLQERGWSEVEGAASAMMYQIEEQEELDPYFNPGFNIENRALRQKFMNLY